MVVNKCSVCGGDAVFREHPDKDTYVVSCCGVTYKVKKTVVGKRAVDPSGLKLWIRSQNDIGELPVLTGHELQKAF